MVGAGETKSMWPNSETPRAAILVGKNGWKCTSFACPACAALLLWKQDPNFPLGKPSISDSQSCSLSGNSHIPTLLQERVHEPGQAPGSTSLRCTRLVQRWHVTLTRPMKRLQGNPKEPGKRHHCLLLTSHDLRPHTPWASGPS